ncbi:alcohol dehydrogenase catalytic domain-containing protein [Mycolicibacterium mageritense]|uniref:alcohol dehydrogenase catalytic domain-containing protein n=1 Tax=Mycolicibacterium mageritense TaxID=53462 RepID=UPI001E600D28|nr:alcohol dehydrogenase catalytic domain-containing protein [Mycolicibacterium mageritense]GJJ17393.1 alcohol dehydrogenase [Mycolicibacterium mageritense]
MTTAMSQPRGSTTTTGEQRFRQAVLYRPNDIRIESAAMPVLQPGDVLLRVDAALLCGTDVRIYEGRKQKNVTFPSVLGHEFAGTVVDANGPLPDGIGMGDQVAVYPLVTCGRCAACLRGHENICRNRKAFGYQLTGGLSQYVHVPAVARQNLVPVPGVPATQAAIIEPVACAYNGQKLAGMSKAQTALIVGCGPLGLIHTGLAKSLGVEKVAAVDPIAGRREMATRFGADLVLEPGPDTAAALDDFTDGGIDVLVMAIGRIDALTPYLANLAPGARVSVFAGFGADADLAVSANDVHYNEWTIVGASSCRLDGFHAVAPMVASGQLPVAELIGTQLPLDQAVEAISLAGSGADMRVGVDPWA